MCLQQPVSQDQQDSAAAPHDKEPIPFEGSYSPRIYLRDDHALQDVHLEGEVLQSVGVDLRKGVLKEIADGLCLLHVALHQPALGA